MKHILIIILIFSFSFKTYSQHQFKLDLNHIASVTFPDTAKSQPDETGIMYGVQSGGNTYLAGTTIIHKGLFDIFKRHFEDSVYAGIIEGALTGTKGKLLYRKNINIQSTSGIEFCYTATVNGLDYTMYNRSFYCDTTLIFYSCWLPAPTTKDDEGLKTFFNSLKFNGAIERGNTDKVAYKIGYILGALLFVGVIVLLGFGIIYIIRKIIYK